MDSNGRSPPLQVSVHGHVAVVKLLLAEHDVCRDAADATGRNAHPKVS